MTCLNLSEFAISQHRYHTLTAGSVPLLMRQVGIFLFEPRDFGLHELVEIGELLPAARAARLPCGQRAPRPSAVRAEHAAARVQVGCARTLCSLSLLRGVPAGLRLSGNDHHAKDTH